MRSLWDAEVKPSSAPIYRQATAKLEANVRNRQGWVMNPVLNPQSVDPTLFPQFRQKAREVGISPRAVADL